MGSFSDMHVRLVLSGKNLGFAEGVNSGLPYCTQPYVLRSSNDDAALEPGSLGILVSEMQRVVRLVGLAPKVLLDLPEPVIDNVGAAITPDGSVHNRGYNQKDIGQFDEQVDVAGACFAKTLLRREAFELSNVGPLDTHYFMYAEDSDWCLRARPPGYRFVACPEAVVRHAHSLSSATLPSTFKWQLIRRNSMLTVVKGFPRRLASKLVYGYMHDSLLTVARSGDRPSPGHHRHGALRGAWSRGPSGNEQPSAALSETTPWTPRLFNPHVAAQPNSTPGAA